MWTEQEIRELIDSYTADKPVFLVELKLGADGRIGVFIGSDNGASVKDCEQLNRFLSEALDREHNDFELVVSTAGVGEPLKVWRQYTSNVGRDVKVKLTEGGSIEGKLTAAEDNRITVLTRSKERIEGRKSKQWVEQEHVLDLSAIAETKVLISFK